jgi:hypothetical protein
VGVAVRAERAAVRHVARSAIRREVAVSAAFIGGVLLVTAFPFLYAYLSEPADKRFMGILLNVPDYSQYLSWSREFGKSLLIDNMLTPERGPTVFFNLFFLMVGRLGSLLGLGSAEALQFMRPIAGAVYLAAIYWYIRLNVLDALHRWVAFLVASLGGGLGWLLIVQKQFTRDLPFPLDVYVSEANTFLTVMAFPHQAMATGLLVLIFALAGLALERRSYRLASCAGVLALLLGVQHGYDLVVVYGVVGLTTLILAAREKTRLQPLLLGATICGPSLPAAAYLTYITRESPIWRGVLEQYSNAGVYTPNPAHLLVLMGVPLILVVAGLPWRLWPVVEQALGRGRARRVGIELGQPRVNVLSIPPQRHAGTFSGATLLLGVWFGVGFLLLYIPTDFQIKMLAGWQVPVAVLATKILFEQLEPALRRLPLPTWSRSHFVLGALFVAAVLPVNMYLYAWRITDLERHDYPYYLYRDEAAALHWLNGNAQPRDVVLSSLTIGQYVPGIAGTHAFLAHWTGTLDYHAKRRMVDAFFQAALPEERRRELIARFNVRYVFYGPQERALGGYDPQRSPYLRRVYSNQSVSVFEARETGSNSGVSQ